MSALAAVSGDPNEPDDDLDEVETFEDFDAYWEQRERAARPVVVRVHGVDVEAPADLPIELQLRPEKWATAETFEEVRGFLELMLGDVVDDLVDAGLGLREMQLLITWAYANGSGRRVTLAEADGLLAEAEAAESGKARVQRRAETRAGAGTGRSRRSGGGSRRTGR